MTGAAVRWAHGVLAEQAAAGLLRSPRQRPGGSAARGLMDGRPVVVFSSNDYLGLAGHPRVRRAAADAALADGVGATGSRHLSGCHPAIAALEAELSAFEHAPTATLAPSGYQANVAVLQALGGPDAVIFSDAANHASIVDGCRLARASLEVYRHCDLCDLEARLRRASGRRVVVSDTVFSMDGDVADVAGLAALADRYDAWLVLDEAHATGVLGPGGRGAAAGAALTGGEEHVVRVVTLSKALGAGGGAVLGGPLVRQLLLQRGRALIFSTALPLPTLAAARAALALLREEPHRVERVRSLARRLRAGLAGQAPPSARTEVPIVPVIAGEPAQAVALEERLLAAGYLVQAVRPPAVPAGTSRVRAVVTAAHQEAEVDGLAAALRSALAGPP